MGKGEWHNMLHLVALENGLIGSFFSIYSYVGICDDIIKLYVWYWRLRTGHYKCCLLCRVLETQDRALQMLSCL